MYPFLHSKAVGELEKHINSQSGIQIISICGGSCSGKTTLCEYLQACGIGNVLSMDSFYKPITEISLFRPGIPAFDTPDAFDLNLIIDSLIKVKQGITVQHPVYEYSNLPSGRDITKYKTFVPASVNLFDGILSYCNELIPYVDYAVYVDRPDTARRTSRIARDTVERGVTSERVATLYDQMVRPLHNHFILPQKNLSLFVIKNES